MSIFFLCFCREVLERLREKTKKKCRHNDISSEQTQKNHCRKCSITIENDRKSNRTYTIRILTFIVYIYEFVEMSYKCEKFQENKQMDGRIDG